MRMLQTREGSVFTTCLYWLRALSPGNLTDAFSRDFSSQEISESRDAHGAVSSSALRVAR